MIAQTWPPLSYWLEEADDRMVATAVDILQAQAAEIERARGAADE